MTWNEFRNQAKSVAGRAADKTKTVAGLAADKTKSVAGRASDKINQSASLVSLQIKLSAAERKLSAAYEALGKIAYKHFTEEQDTDVQKVTTAVEALNVIQADIKGLKAQIELLKKTDDKKEEPKEEEKEEESTEETE